MKPRFDGFQFMNQGFDGDCIPPFQMIPVYDVRSVWLYDADGMDVRSVVPGVIRVEEKVSPKKNLRIFKLHGLMAGKTFVEVRQKSMLITHLEIAVVSQMSFTVSFNFVSDREKGSVIHQTKRSRSEIDDLITFANNYISNQTNIKIIKHNIRDIFVDKNLGDVISFPDDWYSITNKGDKSAILNVFFVWALDNAAGMNLDCAIMIQDELNGVPTENVLAHEIGHFLGLPDENRKNKETGFLMSTGQRTRRNEILVMRRVLAHILKLTAK